MKVKIKFKDSKNYKQVEVLPYNQLTLSKYNEILKILSERGEISFTDYLGVIHNVTYKAAMNATIKGENNLKHLGDLYFVVGLGDRNKNLRYIEDIKPLKVFRFKDKIYDFRSVNIRARGYRIILQQYLNNKPNLVDIYTFTVAMLIDDDFNFDNILEIQKELSDYNYIDVLRIGCFFFKSIMIGELFAVRCLLKLTRKLLTWTMLSESKQDQRSWKNIILNLKRKLFVKHSI